MIHACCLTIAGSDSGGNAGIQADLRTFHAHGLHGCSVITAVTAQNPFGVSAIQTLPSAIIRAQLEAVLGTYHIAALKTGMLASAEIIEEVAAVLQQVPHIYKVIDPVMVATSGARLLESNAIDTFTRNLISLATCLTPNLPEAEVLLGQPIPTLESAIAAAQTLNDRHGIAILLKGGHRSSSQMTDVFCDTDGSIHLFQTPRIDHYRSVHGTGCTLAAAITAGLTQGKTLLAAIQQAKDYVTHAIQTSYDVGENCGVLGF